MAYSNDFKQPIRKFRGLARKLINTILEGIQDIDAIQPEVSGAKTLLDHERFQSIRINLVCFFETYQNSNKTFCQPDKF